MIKGRLPSPRDKDCDNLRLCPSAGAMHPQNLSALRKQSSEDFCTRPAWFILMTSLWGGSFEEHLNNIRHVPQKLKEVNPKLSPSKCHLFWHEVTYLRHIISAEVLAYPEIGKKFILDTDASHESIGAVLSQEIDGQERFAGDCEILGIDKTRKTALHPQSDGMVERFNRIILNSLSLLVSSNQQNWDKKIALFPACLQERRSRETGYSPFQMLFGRDLYLSADLQLSQQPDAPLVHEEYVEKLQAWMKEIHHPAKERIGMTSEKLKTRYSARATRHDFHEGDKVWLWNPKCHR
ncbi:retrovirus-related Pol polyprotein from transposon 297 [Trichonephila clavipes]|nr:retrovirus-related Pol polyprotein from transposon 297 [Trichonephila clavipes]